MIAHKPEPLPIQASMLNRADRKAELLKRLGRSMWMKLAVGFASVATGLLFCALGWQGAGAAWMLVSACSLIAGAWSAIQMDCVDDLLGEKP